MSQRDSGYARKERDAYETPEWVTKALIPHLPTCGPRVWEPAAGSGKMVTVLRQAGFDVHASDIADGQDFLFTIDRSHRVIITNPPYVFAQRFIEHAMRLVGGDGLVAMLLRTDFDHAKSRQHLFGNCPQFFKKLVLTKRIKWFEESTGQPSFNHAWYIWYMRYREAPTLVYGP